MSRCNFRTNSVLPSFSQTLGYLKPTVEDKTMTWLWLNCAIASFHFEGHFDGLFLCIELFHFLSLRLSHIFPKLLYLAFCGKISFFCVTAYSYQHFVKLLFVLFFLLFAYLIPFPRILFDFAFEKIY